VSAEKSADILPRFKAWSMCHVMTQISLTPADAAIITGVMPATQRDWRRHKALSTSSDGWTRYDAVGVAELSLLKILAAHGKLKEGAEAARQLAVPLGRYFQDEANGNAGSPPEHVSVIWADGTVAVYPSFQAAFDAATDAQQSGPMTVLSLQTLSVPLWIKLRDFLTEEGELVE